MHRVCPLILIGLLFLLLPAPLVAEDEGEVPAAPEEPVWDGDRYWFAEVLPPAKAWPKLMAQVRVLPRARWRTRQQQLSAEYLEVWESSKQTAALDDYLALYSFYYSVQEYAGAADSMKSVLASSAAEPALKDRAANSLAMLLRSSGASNALKGDGVEGIVEVVKAYLSGREGDDGARVRAVIHQGLAAVAQRAKRTEAFVEHTLQAAKEDPGQAAGAGRTIVRTLMGSTHSMEGYEALKERAGELLTGLKTLAAAHLETAKAGGDERTLKRAEAGVDLLEKVARPIEMLGSPAETWTLEKAYGDVESIEDLNGKVVLLDFWATWCPWCIKSFPAIRDLLRDYADRGLVVVGVTASARSVYAQRYDLDDDLKDRAGAERPKPAAQLDQGQPSRDPSIPLLPEAEYRQVEIDTITEFIKNHEMTWPVVMIDKKDPGEKFALTGWPHAVVLDREGRVRYFKSGALLRDKVEAVEAFRAVLDDLLAEDVPQETE